MAHFFFPFPLVLLLHSCFILLHYLCHRGSVFFGFFFGALLRLLPSLFTLESLYIGVLIILSSMRDIDLINTLYWLDGQPPPGEDEDLMSELSSISLKYMKNEEQESSVLDLFYHSDSTISTHQSSGSSFSSVKSSTIYSAPQSTSHSMKSSVPRYNHIPPIHPNRRYSLAVTPRYPVSSSSSITSSASLPYTSSQEDEPPETNDSAGEQAKVLSQLSTSSSHKNPNFQIDTSIEEPSTLLPSSPTTPTSPFPLYLSPSPKKGTGHESFSDFFDGSGPSLFSFEEHHETPVSIFSVSPPISPDLSSVSHDTSISRTHSSLSVGKLSSTSPTELLEPSTSVSPSGSSLKYSPLKDLLNRKSSYMQPLSPVNRSPEGTISSLLPVASDTREDDMPRTLPPSASVLSRGSSEATNEEDISRHMHLHEAPLPSSRSSDQLVSSLPPSNPPLPQDRPTSPPALDISLTSVDSDYKAGETQHLHKAGSRSHSILSDSILASGESPSDITPNQAGSEQDWESAENSEFQLDSTSELQPALSPSLGLLFAPPPASHSGRSSALQKLDESFQQFSRVEEAFQLWRLSLRSTDERRKRARTNKFFFNIMRGVELSIRIRAAFRVWKTQVLWGKIFLFLYSIHLLIFSSFLRFSQ